MKSIFNEMDPSYLFALNDGYLSKFVPCPFFPKEWEQKCPEFSQLRRRQEELPELGGLKLNALLITPVQRVPR